MDTTPEPTSGTKTVRFYGASDDLVEIEGIEGADEFNVGDGRIWQAGFVIESRPFKMLVSALYGPGGVWSFAPGMVDDGDPLPPWPMRIGQCQDPLYSTTLEIDVPADAVLYRADRNGKRWEDEE